MSPTYSMHWHTVVFVVIFMNPLSRLLSPCASGLRTHKCISLYWNSEKNLPSKWGIRTRTRSPSILSSSSRTFIINELTNSLEVRLEQMHDVRANAS